MYKSLPGAKQIYAAVEAPIVILTLLFKLLIKILFYFQIPIRIKPPTDSPIRKVTMETVIAA